MNCLVEVQHLLTVSKVPESLCQMLRHHCIRGWIAPTAVGVGEPSAHLAKQVDMQHPISVELSYRVVYVEDIGNLVPGIDIPYQLHLHSSSLLSISYYTATQQHKTLGYLGNQKCIFTANKKGLPITC